MSAPTLEGGQDDDDILGFPGDGFVDKTDGNPGVLVVQAYYQAFFWVLIDLIVELLGLIIKPFDNQTER
jgi:hypothetical protein